jgi:hypothetical protein
MPTKCPFCTGDIIWGPAEHERDQYRTLAQIFAIVGLIGLPILGAYAKIDVDWWILALIGGVGGFMFPYMLAQKG